MDDDEAVGEDKSIIHENALHVQAAPAGYSEPYSSCQDDDQPSRELESGAQHSEEDWDSMGFWQRQAFNKLNISGHEFTRFQLKGRSKESATYTGNRSQKSAS